MNILSSIFTDDLAIDLGTVNTLIFAPDRGVVLNEPSAVAIHRYTGEVLEVGADAIKMLGREPKDVEVFRPVRGGAIVSSASLLAAGNAMDEAIRDYVRSKYEMQLGERTAEQVKKEFSAVLSEGEAGEQRREIVGKQLTDGLAKVVEISAAEIREALEPVISEIVTGARKAIEESKPDVTADIYQTGLILTGGGALLGGLAERLQKELRLHVAVAEEPLAAVALGAGRLLADKARLNRSAIRDDVPVWQSQQELVVNW